nr:hypothetical protein [Chroococcidiopsis sp. CCALA 051]
MTFDLSKRRFSLWFERLMAIAATVNFGLVIFDFTYVPWRDFYLNRIPEVTTIYDPIKGIEPHRETQQYLKLVNALEQQVSQTGLQSPQTAAVLEQLRRYSSDIIETNPFALANKTGTLERIKNRMRDRIGEESSRTAFNIFWSQEYLLKAGWQKEIDFFNRSIRPLVATNYYRAIGENGEFIDEFWGIDAYFIVLFGVEFLIRTFIISRRHVGLKWQDAMLWRWYDILLIVPFELLPFLRWTWLRIIPVTVRLHQAKLLNLEPVRRQATQGFVASLAQEITEVVLIQFINQLQVSVRRGELTNWLSASSKRQPYIDLNNINEIETIASLVVNVLVYQVFPQIEPDIIAILRHSIESTLDQSPLYRSIQNLPGVGNFPHALSQQLATSITQNFYTAIVKAVEDPVGAKISRQLAQHFSQALGRQMQEKHTLERIQSLISDFLEEVKLNYVRRLAQEDVEQIMEQTRLLKRGEK